MSPAIATRRPYVANFCRISPATRALRRKKSSSSRSREWGSDRLRAASPRRSILRHRWGHLEVRCPGLRGPSWTRLFRSPKTKPSTSREADEGVGRGPGGPPNGVRPHQCKCHFACGLAASSSSLGSSCPTMAASLALGASSRYLRKHLADSAYAFLSIRMRPST